MESNIFESPMKWDVFKRLPKETQKEYIENLQQAYSVTAIGLANMFGVSALTVRKYLSEEHGIKFTRGKSMKPFEEAAWSEFIAREPPKSAFDTVDEQHGTKLTHFSLEFNGSIDIDEIYNSLKVILGDTSHGRIEIMCDLT